MKAVLCGALVLLTACVSRGGSSPADDAPYVWVNVRTVELVGVDEKDRGPILDLKLFLSPRDGGFVEQRKGLPVVSLTIADLGSGVERRLDGSALQRVVETIAAYYSRQERLGMRADIVRSDFERMLKGDTCLRIRIRKPAI